MESRTSDTIASTPYPLMGKVKEIAGMISDCPNRQAKGSRATASGKIRIGQYNNFWAK